jgi:hypothetical protein
MRVPIRERVTWPLLFLLQKVSNSVADRDVYPGSRIRLFSIPDPGSDILDPNCLHPGSSKNLSILTPKKATKWFLISKKYISGCSSRIPDRGADFLPSRIPDPGVKKASNPRSRNPDQAPQHWYLIPFCRMQKGTGIS